MVLDNINSDLKEAMRARDSFKTTLLRGVLASLKNEAIEKHKMDEGLGDEEVIAVLKREVKKRKDSAMQFMQGNRPELAQKENDEISLIAKYLPAEMSEEELRKIVAEVIAEMGEVNSSQFGAVMKNVMAKAKGQADGGMVSRIAKESLK